MEKLRGQLRGLRRTVWGRTILFSLCTLIILATAVLTVSTWSQNVLRQQIVSLSNAQTAAGLEQVSGELTKLENLQNTLLFDEDINRLGVIPNYFTVPQTTQVKQRVIRQLGLIADASPLAKSAYFLAPAINRQFTEGGVDELDTALFYATLPGAWQREGGLTAVGNDRYLVAAYPAYPAFLREHGAMYILLVKLNKTALLDMLEGLTSEAGECVLLYENGSLLSSVGTGGLALDTGALLRLSIGTDAFDVQLGDGERYIAVAKTNAAMAMTLIKLLPANRVLASMNTLRSLFLLLLTLTVLGNLLYAVRLWRHIHRPLSVLSDALEKVERGVLSTRIHHARDDEFADIYHRFNAMNRQLETLIEQVYKQTIRMQRAELKQLQSQINPHFLYNSFFMMKACARMGDCETIERLTDELGEYFRYVTRNGEEEADLSQEVAHARHYTEIQNMRFSKRIHLAFDNLPNEMATLRVPRLIIQPLIENAYGHGLSETPGKSELHVMFRTDGEQAVITVEDSGGGLSDAALSELAGQLDAPDASETTGILNIHRRLRLRFGKPYGLTLSRSALGGLRADIVLPAERTDTM